MIPPAIPKTSGTPTYRRLLSSDTDYALGTPQRTGARAPSPDASLPAGSSLAFPYGTQCRRTAPDRSDILAICRNKLLRRVPSVPDLQREARPEGRSARLRPITP